MPKIAIISASIRNQRNSHRAALYFEKFIRGRNLASTVMLDLLAYDFPIFHERLKYLKDPAASVVEFADQIKSADGVIIVTPEYNGGYPASIKNAIDLLYEEWYKKPISVVTVSDGAYAGTQVITSLLFTLWKIRAWVVPPAFPVPKVLEMFDEAGDPIDPITTNKRAQNFIDELLWSITAKEKMSSN
jgi:NAD(P)H-dependent FMN reductase